MRESSHERRKGPAGIVARGAAQALICYSLAILENRARRPEETTHVEIAEIVKACEAFRPELLLKLIFAFNL
jgi:hypothetical protein